MIFVPRIFLCWALGGKGVSHVAVYQPSCRSTSTNPVLRILESVKTSPVQFCVLLEYFFQSALDSDHSNKIYRLQCYITFHNSQVTFERAMLTTKIESLFNIYYGFIFFQGICTECRITLGEHVRADYQDPQLIALTESIHELSLESTSYFGCLAHTTDFICNYIQHQSLNLIRLPYNSDSASPFLIRLPNYT